LSKGEVDYLELLTELDRLGPDLPVMLEHLPNQGEYDLAAAFVRSRADQLGVGL
jgi:hypothetical protein